MEIENVITVADGLAHPEGPVALADGSLIVVEIGLGRVTVIRPGARPELIADVGGGPNGAALGPDGALYVCNNGGFKERYRPPGIQRVDLISGGVDDLYLECDGRSLAAPNDIVFDRTGNFWFTDYGVEYGRNAQTGGIYYATPDGSDIRLVVPHVAAANGIGLSPNGQTLYWVQTTSRQIFKRTVTSPGELEPSVGLDIRNVVRTGELDPFVLLIGLPGYGCLDSLALETNGNVCAGTILDGCITVVSPDGGWFERMTLPAELSDPLVTNICFGGLDMRTAYITLTSTGRVIACRWPRPGLELAFQEIA